MLLDLQELRAEITRYDRDGTRQVVEVLRGVSFRVVKGRILGLVGEARSGKSLTVAAMLGLLPPAAHATAGRALFEGQDLLRMGEADLGQLRGARIGLVVPSAQSALDPRTRIGRQLLRAQGVHRRVARAEAEWRAETILSSMGIPEPRARLAAWPHELSAGTAQRVLVALALINDPQLLISDDATAGLDTSVQAQILDLMHVEVRRRRIGALLITHDLGVVAQYCDDVAVMFAGQVVEQGPVGHVFSRPAHPYTRTLLAAAPERLVLGSGRRFSGPPADYAALAQGCVYRARCSEATERCAEAPPLVGAGVHAARCHFARLGAA